ncbi:MAG: long-chain fatty acid transporter [Betaproteobacteria bacterium]|nr:MAG: long-chain fatty acid transporter [Betaproteobacteria bacterium]
MKRSLLTSVLLAVFAIPSVALATDGYYPHGYGMKAKGMGGASVARAVDAFGGANNPASMVWAGDRLDIGLDLFSPRRSIERTGAAAPGPGFAPINGSADSGSNQFFIPEFGYNKMLGWDMSAGVTVYGNGGMNTDYPGGQLGGNTACGGFNPTPAAPTTPNAYNLLCGTGRLGLNLEQLIVAPTFAMKVNKDHSFGVSLLLAYQKFKVEGLDGIWQFTQYGPPGTAANWAANNNLTNRGNATSTGVGLRLGWMGKVSDTVTLGASYATKTRMQKFDKYKDLFPGQGMFDMPSNLTLGIEVKTTPKLTLAADFQRIDYSGIRSVGAASTNLGNANPAFGGITGSLGCDSCRGFGWSSVNVFKLGGEYQYNPNLILRAGYNHSDNPISGRDVTFNIMAPGVVKDHATLGFTYSLSKESELTMAYMHAFKNSVEAASLFSNWLGAAGGTEKIQMYQNSLGIAYSMKLK